jgi:hypothetical protein
MAHQMPICLRHGLMCTLELLPFSWESSSSPLARPVTLRYFSHSILCLWFGDFGVW